jgi:hypothetical protein
MLTSLILSSLPCAQLSKERGSRRRKRADRMAAGEEILDCPNLLAGSARHPKGATRPGPADREGPLCGVRIDAYARIRWLVEWKAAARSRTPFAARWRTNHAVPVRESTKASAKCQLRCIPAQFRRGGQAHATPPRIAEAPPVQGFFQSLSVSLRRSLHKL